MKSSKAIAIFVAGLAVAVSGIAAFAQDPTANPGQGGFGGGRRGGGGPGGGFGGPGGGRGGFGGPGGGFGQGGFGGGFGGPGGGMTAQLGANGANDHNPMVSHSLYLLSRQDVQSHLHISIKQKEALGELTTAAQQETRNQMTQVMQNMRQQLSAQPQQNLSRQERMQQMQSQMQAIQPQLQAAMDKVQGEIDGRFADILSAEQLKRLSELDMQWRGPLAMGAEKAAKLMNISSESKNLVLGIYNDYTKTMQEARNQMMQNMRGNRGGFNAQPGGQPGQPGISGQPGQPGTGAGQDPNAQAGTTAGAQQNPQQNFQTMMKNMQKADEEARKEAEAKALKTVTPEEKNLWKAANGEKFTFRKDI